MGRNERLFIIGVLWLSMLFSLTQNVSVIDLNKTNNFQPLNAVLLGDESCADADAVLQGESGTNYAGYSLSRAGDLNRDGYDDFLIGAYGYNSQQGRAYVIFGNGSSNPLIGTSNLAQADVSFSGESSGDRAGYSLASAGDFNADGYADFLIGAPLYGSDQGRVYLFYGNETSCLLAGNWTLSINIANVTFTGEGADSMAGLHVAGVGDVNGDGCDDLCIGAPEYNLNHGRIYLFYGNRSSGLLRGEYNCSMANATFTGGMAGDYAGASISQIGDVNGDGCVDLLFGAPGYDSFRGQAYLLYGTGSSNPIGGSYDLYTDANATFTGEEPNSYFGYSLAGIGDLNRDNFQDFLFGAPAYNSNRGRAYLFYGNDSTKAFFGLYNASLANATFTGESMNDQAGWSVGGPGDVSGDGYSDILIGAWGYLSNTGRTYLFYGNFSSRLMLGDYNCAQANATFTGEGTSNNAGCAVSGAGDVDGDGYADIIIGASAYGGNRGRTYLFYGCDLGSPASIIDLLSSEITPISVILSWTATGDDGWTGQVATFVIKWRTNPINNTNWITSPGLVIPATSMPGFSQTESITGLSPSTTYYVAIKAVDDLGIESPISNILIVTTPIKQDSGVITFPLEMLIIISMICALVGFMLGIVLQRRKTQKTQNIVPVTRP